MEKMKKTESLCNVKEKVKKYGSISDWNKFLQQFPNLGNNKYL